VIGENAAELGGRALKTKILFSVVAPNYAAFPPNTPGEAGCFCVTQNHTATASTRIIRILRMKRLRGRHKKASQRVDLRRLCGGRLHPDYPSKSE
jgi:hypothetical protein